METWDAIPARRNVREFADRVGAATTHADRLKTLMTLNFQ